MWLGPCCFHQWPLRNLLVSCWAVLCLFSHFTTAEVLRAPRCQEIHMLCFTSSRFKVYSISFTSGSSECGLLVVEETLWDTQALRPTLENPRCCVDMLISWKHCRLNVSIFWDYNIITSFSPFLSSSLQALIYTSSCSFKFTAFSLLLYTTHVCTCTHTHKYAHTCTF